MAGIRVVKLDQSQAVPSANPIFRGAVVIQEIVGDALGDLLRVNAVTFQDGAVNRPHRHAADQVLVATSGNGFIATEDETLPMTAGDVAFIPKNTRHWHGARPGESFTHLSILTPGHMEILDDAQG